MDVSTLSQGGPGWRTGVFFLVSGRSPGTSFRDSDTKCQIYAAQRKDKSDVGCPIKYGVRPP